MGLVTLRRHILYSRKYTGLHAGNGLQSNSSFLYFIEETNLRDLFIYILYNFKCILYIYIYNNLNKSTRICQGLLGSIKVYVYFALTRNERDAPAYVSPSPSPENIGDPAESINRD